MSDMKCPFCQQELRKIHPTYVICDNCRITGEDKLWQELIRTRKALETENKDLSDKIGKLETELERTRKALEKAKLVLVDLRDHAELDGIQEWDVYETLSEITALEQKDAK